MLSLHNIFDLTHKFADIERDMYYPDPLRKENDAEHAFQLALIAWYIIDSNKITLDQNKIFKLCLARLRKMALSILISFRGELT